ncbi:hypothetical protein HALO32_02909 [Halomonas lysinitropha]|uniref:Uncharacterized protein n=1 Tax=Halomonas lysinitropha TaxID=2607506 RepID=A0A5K1IBI0_9GAMM|nr:hypothetical protein HALO32_02909 [Halomonas lysinitropha]
MAFTAFLPYVRYGTDGLIVGREKIRMLRNASSDLFALPFFLE